MTTAETFNRLQWRSRRGMLELDALLVPFTQACFQALSASEQVAYSQLLACEDPELLGWFMTAQRPDDPAVSGMVDKVLQYSHAHALT